MAEDLRELIGLKEILIPSALSIAASYQISTFAIGVGAARSKFKVQPPATTGDDGFERVYRAHQNVLEFVPVFYPAVWVSSLFFHPVPTAIASIGYMYARQKYFTGYSKSVEDRVPGFKLSVKFIKLLVLMASLGLVSFSLKTYMNVDIPSKINGYISQLIPS